MSRSLYKFCIQIFAQSFLAISVSAYPPQLKSYSWNWLEPPLAQVIYLTYNGNVEGLTQQQVYTALHNAVVKWNATVPADRIQLSLPEDALNNKEHFDGLQPSNSTNELFWTHDCPDPPNWTDIARTDAWPIQPENIDCWTADVGLIYYYPNNPQMPNPYTWSVAPVSSDQLDVESLALHEIGHILGLDNIENNPLYANAVMYAPFTPDPETHVKQVLTDYDLAAVKTIYNFDALAPEQALHTGHPETFRWQNLEGSDMAFINTAQIYLNRNNLESQGGS